ncbi:MAG: uroporphyrinogen decarboxylase family protein [Kiritimatiellia bacterium]|nr:uroporphyrinogen decarboxylase family protein [Kiritimatiellia bacterium]
MNQRERFQAALRHEKEGGAMFYFKCTPDLEKRLRQHEGLDEASSLERHFGLFDPALFSIQRPDHLSPPDYSVYFKGVDRPEGSHFDRNGCLHVPGSLYHFTHLISPLRHAGCIEDIESFPWPDYSLYESEHIRPGIEAAHAEGRVAGVWVTHMYEDAWQVRGYEEFLMDMVEQPDWAHAVLNRFQERNLRIAIEAAESGADMLITGDDVANQNAMMFSKDVWREFIKSKWAEVYAAAKSRNPGIRIWYHSDGNIEEILPELIEIGVDIFNPLQPECVDLAKIKKRYGDRMVMDGTIGTQTTMPFGTADDVRACVRTRADELGQDGALILSPTHVLEPEVPIANILAFVESCRALS